MQRRQLVHKCLWNFKDEKCLFTVHPDHISTVFLLSVVCQINDNECENCFIDEHFLLVDIIQKVKL